MSLVHWTNQGEVLIKTTVDPGWFRDCLRFLHGTRYQAMTAPINSCGLTTDGDLRTVGVRIMEIRIVDSQSELECLIILNYKWRIADQNCHSFTGQTQLCPLMFTRMEKICAVVGMFTYPISSYLVLTYVHPCPTIVDGSNDCWWFYAQSLLQIMNQWISFLIIISDHGITISNHSSA